MRNYQNHNKNQMKYMKLGKFNKQSNLNQITTQINLKLRKSQNQTQCNINTKSVNQHLDNLLKKFQQEIAQLSKLANNKQFQPFFNKADTNINQVCQNFNKLLIMSQEIEIKLKDQKINQFLIKYALQFLLSYIGQKNLQNSTDSEKVITILDFQFKVLCSIDLLIRSLTLPDDITTLPKEKYNKVWSCMKFQICGNQTEVLSQLNYMKKIMAITTSAVLNQHQKTGAFTKIVAFGLSYPQYYFTENQHIFRSMKFNRKPSIQMAQNIWNLPQNGLIKQLTKFSLKSIQTNIKIYIPSNRQRLPQDICVYNHQAIKVRLLYHEKIYSINKKSSSTNFFCCGAPNIAPKQITSIIIHFHGGGFVALSSSSMQTYTRKWACELKVPVFSIDYRKPPSHRFPTAPFDCLTVYTFLINHIHKYFNISPEKIILAGDSAGGNLACSLMGLILKYKLPRPYGIFLAYPACDLRKIFSPSRTYSFKDPLLNPPMLMLCLNQYLNNRQQFQQDPLASPILLTQQYVNGTLGDKSFPKAWPKTIIQVGAKDPLFDDSLKLMQRLVSIYQNLSHGFLSLDFIVPSCSNTITDSIKYLQELLLS